MYEHIKTERVKASRDYECEACIWIDSDCIENWGLNFSEYRSYIKARNTGFKIKKGQTYNRTKHKWDGEFYTFRAIPEIDAICQRLDVYDC